MIDFELYRIFVAVAKEENITKASEIFYHMWEETPYTE